MKKGLLLLLFFTAMLLLNASNYNEKNGIKYLPDRIIVKFKSDLTGTASINTLSKTSRDKLEAFGVKNYKNMFEAKKIGKEKLQNIYQIKYSSPADPYYAAAKLSKLPEIEWAEPYYIYDIALTPNDFGFPSEYSLTKIDAKEAWDITTGSPEIIIGIVDTGVDWDHPDLAANIWTNEAELNGVAGVDDDNNGYVDDIRGWDFGGLDGVPDNDPMEDRPDHGTHVAGIAGAVTNNGVGVASIGYNCKVMAVKTSQDNIRDAFGNPLVSYGYEGIIYAADNGAKVINCSWGSYSYSAVFQEIINYLSANGVLLVGAAGNENTRDAIYPGNYDGALSVGYSNSQDKRDPFSNYGEEVDVFAPGSAIYGTWQDDTYRVLNGSSMASPLVAGLAGLVFSKFPEYNGMQVGEQIRVNADKIDDLNPGYEYLLGSGRVNAYKALSNVNSKSVRVKEVKFYDQGDGDGIFESGEKVAVEIKFVNYLSDLTGLSIDMATISPFIEIDNSSINFGSKTTLEEFDNNGNLFSFTINSSTPLNTEIALRLQYSDGSYSDFEWLDRIIINPLYKTTSKNDIHVTITSKGTLAYNDYPDNQQGDGFTFMDGPDILFEGGLMYGNSAERMVSTVRDESGQSQSNEFRLVQPFVMQTPGDVADEQGLSIFNDDGAGLKRYSIETELHTYTFADDESKDFIILKYIFKNTSTNNYTDFYAGLFFDWDIDGGSADQNKVNYNVSDRFGYAYNTDLDYIDTHAGVVVLSTDTDGFYAINNVTYIYDGFTESEKWASLTSKRNHTQEGPSDISFVSSSGPHTIDANGQLEIAFALIAGPGLDELKNAANRSREKYQSLITDVQDSPAQPIEYSLSQNYPNPFNPSTVINYSIPKEGQVTIKVFDILGREITTLINDNVGIGNHSITWSGINSNGISMSSGVYFYSIEYNNIVINKKMLLIR